MLEKERVQIHILPEHKMLIQEAAACKYQTISEFMLDRSLNKAKRIISNRKEKYTLSHDDWEQLCHALLNPKPANQKLTSAMKRYEMLKNSNS